MAATVSCQRTHRDGKDHEAYAQVIVMGVNEPDMMLYCRDHFLSWLKNAYEKKRFLILPDHVGHIACIHIGQHNFERW